MDAIKPVFSFTSGMVQIEVDADQSGAKMASLVLQVSPMAILAALSASAKAGSLEAKLIPYIEDLYTLVSTKL